VGLRTPGCLPPPRPGVVSTPTPPDHKLQVNTPTRHQTRGNFGLAATVFRLGLRSSCSRAPTHPHCRPTRPKSRPWIGPSKAGVRTTTPCRLNRSWPTPAENCAHDQMYAYGQVRVAKSETIRLVRFPRRVRRRSARHEPAVRRCKSVIVPKHIDTWSGVDQTMLVSPAVMSVHAKRSRANEPMS
jgi:hypothetical protein